MSQTTSSILSVAITCDRTGILSESEAKSIFKRIHRRIASEAKFPDSDSYTPGPIFSSELLYADHVIKLWCANHQTLTWLEKTVSGLKFHSPRQLVVKSQSELPKLVNCKFVIPNEQRDTYQELDDIKQVLCHQNPWIEIKRCALSWQNNSDRICNKVMMEIPENLIPTLMKAERRLSIGLSVVYVKFEGSRAGEYNSDFPKGWDFFLKVFEVSTTDYCT